jgi:hypothetical protein
VIVVHQHPRHPPAPPVPPGPGPGRPGVERPHSFTPVTPMPPPVTPMPPPVTAFPQRGAITAFSPKMSPAAANGTSAPNK